MYFYIIEKNINIETFTTDIKIIQNCIENCSEIHTIIRKLFNIENIPNFREKYNILYRFINNGTFKLLIKSDIKINKENLQKLNFSLLEEIVVDIKENQVLDFTILVSPTTKLNNKRVLLKDKIERKDWLKNKLTYNKECEIISINELGSKKFNMFHKDNNKGSSILYGYEYNIKVLIKNKDGFYNLIKKGIGPEKCYGFGLIDYVSNSM